MSKAVSSWHSVTIGQVLFHMWNDVCASSLRDSLKFSSGYRTPKNTKFPEVE